MGPGRLDEGRRRAAEERGNNQSGHDCQRFGAFSFFFCLIGKMVYVFRLAVMHDVNVGVRRFRFR